MADAPTLHCANRACEFQTTEPSNSPVLQRCPKCGGKHFISKKQKAEQEPQETVAQAAITATPTKN